MVDFLPFYLYFCIYISVLSNRLKEGIQIKSSERISITSDKLKIKETLAEDEGLYSLVAVNKEGETRGDIQLQVQCNVLRFLVLFETKLVNPFPTQPSRRLSPGNQRAALPRVARRPNLKAPSTAFQKQGPFLGSRPASHWKRRTGSKWRASERQGSKIHAEVWTSYLPSFNFCHYHLSVSCSKRPGQPAP